MICLRAVSNRAKPKRLVPLVSTDTLGASTGPLVSAMAARSFSDLPVAGGKSAGCAVGWGWAGGVESLLPEEPQPVVASARATRKMQRDRRTRAPSVGAPDWMPRRQSEPEEETQWQTEQRS